MMAFQEMLVAVVVPMLDNLAVGLIIIPIVYLVTGIFRGIETLAFALFRVLIQKLDLSRLYSGLRTLAPVPWSYTL